MAQATEWQSSVRQALLQDPKKTSVMGLLLLVLLFIAGRALLPGTAHPALAAGSIAMPGSAIVPTYSSPALPPAHSSTALRNWLSSPAPSLTRNDFLIRMDDFPLDPAHPDQELSDGKFWTDVEKSLSIQTDQQEQRQSDIAAIKTQAESIRPESTMMGSHPRAIVNGTLLAVGDTIDGFCLLKIEPRGIVVQRDGVKLEVPMRQ